MSKYGIMLPISLNGYHSDVELLTDIENNKIDSIWVRDLPVAQFWVEMKVVAWNLFYKKCSHSVDFYCNTLKFEISRIALNQGFFVSTET